MELRRENVIACDGGGKGARVARLAGGQARLARLAVEAVHEIEAAGVVDALPEGVRRDLPHLVPSHVRHLEARGAALARELEADHFPGQESQSRRFAFRAAPEEHLL